MKRIISFEKKSLKRFIVELNFEKDFGIIDLNQLSKIAENIKEDFPIVPKLVLMPNPGETIEFRPLTFYNKEKKNHIQMGRTFIIFTFEEYNSWKWESKKIVNVINEINNVINLPKIIRINMTYIDEFNLPAENFDLEKYFAIPMKPKNNWDIKFHDFFLGIVPYEDIIENIKNKIVIRLRGIGKFKDKFKFNLESAYIIQNLSLPTEDDNFKIYLDQSHDAIEDHFINFLDDGYKIEIGLEIGEI